MQRLYTAAGAALPNVPWEDYPRPQMVRGDWLCLNGDWDFTANGETRTIRVPFCPESLLSGAAGAPAYGEPMIYRRRFSVPGAWRGKRVLLHFGAVSRRAEVALNGKPLATHENGYLPFTVELTDALRPGENELCVRAVNDLSHKYPWGKQKRERGGMWYTPVSGIWQTVWLEPVPETYISALRIRTGADWFEVAADGVGDGAVLFDGREYPLNTRVPVDPPLLWSPEHPYLYSFSVTAGEDRVASYFALRTLSVEKINGVPRLCLNGKPCFFNGLLDQGYWSDGLYTPPAPESFAQDILAAKSLGFNTLRKHLKIEPERFYYDCDRLGMVVFQDMVNNGDYAYLRDTILPTLHFLRRSDTRMHRDPETRRIFLASMEDTVRLLGNHPCICYWTIFNEGWGQFCADAAYARLKTLDGARFIDAASGWFQQKRSDVESLHLYFEKLRLGKRRELPQVLSEIGGYVWKVPAHSFNPDETYGYKKYSDRESFLAALRELYGTVLPPLVEAGLCAAIYTQLSDVEDETNGLLTFDRRVLKAAPEDLRDLMEKLQYSARQEEAAAI